MPWRPGRNGVRCRVCERETAVCGPLSARGKCFDCGAGRNVAAVIDMHEHDGYFFQQWRRAMAASVGAVLVDDLERES